MTIINYLSNCARTIPPVGFSLTFPLVIYCSTCSVPPPSWSRERKSPPVVSPPSIIPPHTQNKAMTRQACYRVVEARLQTADCTKVELQVGLVRQKND